MAVLPFLLHRPPPATHYNPNYPSHHQSASPAGWYPSNHRPPPSPPLLQHTHIHISRPRPHRPHRRAQTRIVNGALAAEFQFPWFASIRSHSADGLQTVCGGSIIAADWVLSAAHCTHDFVALTLGFGSVHIDRPHVRLSAAAVIEHPDYDAETLNFDIAVIRLPQRLEWSALVQAIRMPSRRQAANNGAFYSQMARVCGYGRASDGEC